METNLTIGPQLDWNAIPLFLAVARVGRLTVAARDLGIDHSTLSRRLTGLEQSLQTKLFERHVNGYTLTQQGERLLTFATSMESLVYSVMSDVGGSDVRVAGTVRIGAPDGFGTQFLAGVLKDLIQQNPELRVELVAMNRMFSLSKREADMAIALARPTEGRLHARKLTDYELGLYVSEKFLSETRPIKTLADLKDAPLIGYIDELLLAQELDFATVVPDMRVVMKSSNIIAQLVATLQGTGFCILPSFFADYYPGLRRVLPEEIQLIRSFWLVTHSDLRDLARVSVTSEFIARKVQRQRQLFLPTAHGGPVQDFMIPLPSLIER